MTTTQDKIKNIEELEATIDNYYAHIQFLQGQLAEAKDLFEAVTTKLKIKSAWAEIWAWVAALLAALLAIKCF